MENYENDKNDFLQTQRIRQLDKYIICKIKTNLSEIRKASPPPNFSTEFSPLYMCCNIHHFGITKRKLWHQNYKLRPQNYKLRLQNYKLRVQNLQVWQLKLISFN